MKEQKIVKMVKGDMKKASKVTKSEGKDANKMMAKHHAEMAKHHEKVAKHHHKMAGKHK